MCGWIGGGAVAAGQSSSDCVTKVIVLYPNAFNDVAVSWLPRWVEVVDSRRIEQDGSFDVVITWGLLDLVERISHLTSPTIDERSVPGTECQPLFDPFRPVIPHWPSASSPSTAEFRLRFTADGAWPFSEALKRLATVGCRYATTRTDFPALLGARRRNRKKMLHSVALRGESTGGPHRGPATESPCPEGAATAIAQGKARRRSRAAPPWVSRHTRGSSH
ncbi:MAG: hypothetical protein RLY70_3190 [Planctomycetota bacterium]